MMGFLTLENGSSNKDMVETIDFKGHFTLTSSYFVKIKGK